MRDNPLQFAVVREDPDLEIQLVHALGCKRVLLIASGGCTGLSIAGVFPEVEITLLDPSQDQLDHVRDKMAALTELGEADTKAAFNIGTSHPDGLSERGNFESLFRGLRLFLYDLVLGRVKTEKLLEEPTPERIAELTGHKFWPVAFDLFFCDSILNTMFGPFATQHAKPGSYPAYFRRAFERGLAAPGAADNPFLHHVFVGSYPDRAAALPRFLAKRPDPDPEITLRRGRIRDQTDLAEFELIGLSNIFDWMGPDDVEEVAGHLAEQLSPGAVVVFRQLNNDRDIEASFGERFRFDDELGAQLLEIDRSLFYESVHVGTKMR